MISTIGKFQTIINFAGNYFLMVQKWQNMIVDTGCVAHTSFLKGVVHEVCVDVTTTTTTTTIRTEDHTTQHYERARSQGHGETHTTAVSFRFGGRLRLRRDVRYSGVATVSK